MENLIKISVNDAIEKHHNRELHERIEKAMRTLIKSEVNILSDYLKLEVRITGLNPTLLAPPRLG